MIPEPQKTYLLELLTALGPAADEFVLVGGQALKFVLAEARATRDFDFLLDAIALRENPANVTKKLAALGYTVVPESRNFQFQKPIPGTSEIMRVEFMAPHELKRGNSFRVDIEKGLHPPRMLRRHNRAARTGLIRNNGHTARPDTCSRQPPRHSSARTRPAKTACAR